MLLLSACGSLVDERSGEEVAERPAPGAVRQAGAWHCVADDDQVWRCHAAAAQATPPTAAEFAPDLIPEESRADLAAVAPTAVNEEAVPQPESVSVAPPAGFVLQFASLRNLDQARTVRATMPSVPLRILRTRGLQGEWYVVVSEAVYPDAASARAAAADTSTGSEFWVRTAADLAGKTLSCPAC